MYISLNFLLFIILARFLRILSSVSFFSILPHPPNGYAFSCFTPIPLYRWSASLFKRIDPIPRGISIFRLWWLNVYCENRARNGHRFNFSFSHTLALLGIYRAYIRIRLLFNRKSESSGRQIVATTYNYWTYKKPNKKRR